MSQAANDEYQARKCPPADVEARRRPISNPRQAIATDLECRVHGDIIHHTSGTVSAHGRFCCLKHGCPATGHNKEAFQTVLDGLSGG